MLPRCSSGCAWLRSPASGGLLTRPARGDLLNLSGRRTSPKPDASGAGQTKDRFQPNGENAHFAASPRIPHVHRSPALSHSSAAVLPLKSHSPIPAQMAESGGVGMWRGSGRPGMSVSAPFVWRCLSGSTIAPFPHPSHRTGHADFPASGSRTRPHAFAHGTSRPSRVRRTSPQVS